MTSSSFLPPLALVGSLVALPSVSLLSGNRWRSPTFRRFVSFHRKSTECSIGRQYLCQSSLALCGILIFSLSSVADYNSYVLFCWTFGANPMPIPRLPLPIQVSALVATLTPSRLTSLKKFVQRGSHGLGASFRDSHYSIIRPKSS